VRTLTTLKSAAARRKSSKSSPIRTYGCSVRRAKGSSGPLHAASPYMTGCYASGAPPARPSLTERRSPSAIRLKRASASPAHGPIASSSTIKTYGHPWRERLSALPTGRAPPGGLASGARPCPADGPAPQLLSSQRLVPTAEHPPGQAPYRKKGPEPGGHPRFPGPCFVISTIVYHASAAEASRLRGVFVFAFRRFSSLRGARLCA